MQQLLFEGNELNSYNYKKFVKLDANTRELIIPENISKIDDKSFENNNLIEGVIFEGDEITVGNFAFNGCKKLNRVVFKCKTLHIEKCAFARCKSLEEIDLSAASEIGEMAFSYCSKLKSVKLSDSLKYINKCAFAFCDGLESISLPDSVEVVNDGAFLNCINLANVRLPEKLSVIPHAMFLYCHSLTEIRIPETVTAIGEYAFQGCHSLKEIIIPESTELIEAEAFTDCKSLFDVTICGSLKKIGMNIFGNICELNIHLTPNSKCEHLAGDNTSLKRVTISGEGARISDCMFHHCENSIPDSIHTIEKDAFAHCPMLENSTDYDDFGDSKLNEGDDLITQYYFIDTCDETFEMYNKKIRIIGVDNIGMTAVANISRKFQSYDSVQFMVVDNTSKVYEYATSNVNSLLIKNPCSLSNSELNCITKFLDDADMLYVCTRLGAYTSEAAQQICEAAKNRGIFTILAYTMPFVFEDAEIMQKAKEHRERIKEKTDAMIEVLTPQNGGTSLSKFFDTTDDSIEDSFCKLIQMTPDFNGENYYVSMEFDIFQEMLCGVKNARFITENIQGNYTQTLSEKLSEIIPKTTQSAIIHFCVPTDFTPLEYNELYDCLNKTLDEKTKAQSSMSFSEDGKNSVSVIEAD